MNVALSHCKNARKQKRHEAFCDSIHRRRLIATRAHYPSLATNGGTHMRDYAIFLVSIGMIAAGTVLSVSGSPSLRSGEEPVASVPAAIRPAREDIQRPIETCNQTTNDQPKPHELQSGDCAHTVAVPTRWPR